MTIEYTDSNYTATAQIERAALASISDGVIVNNVAGQVILINQAASRWLRVEAAAVMGTPVRALFESFSKQGRLTLIDAMERLYSDPYSYGPGEGITETIIDLGAQVIQAHLSPVLTDIGEFVGLVTVLRDVTREVEAERSKTDFVSNVSHELRTPLTSIVGYTDLMLHPAVGPLNEQQSSFLAAIQENTQRLVTLINDLLDISRVESGRLQLEVVPVSLAEVIHAVADMIKPQCDKKNLQLHVSIDPRVGGVLGDKSRLIQVLTNLVSNACSYTPVGGHITLALASSGDTARVDVTDTGIGISPEDQSKIFQRFYRVKGASQFDADGTGLGLSITKMLVEMHGGRVWVNSEVGKGSTFTVVLPVRSAAPVEAKKPIELPAASQVVLVVENETGIARLIDRHLRQAGLEVVLANLGEEALRLAHTRPVDLITLDMRLPDMPGMEMLRRLKTDATTRDIPVVIVSAIRQTGIADDSAPDQATQSLALEKLVEGIRSALSAKALA